MQWLEQQLEGVDRCLTPWLVVSMHRPMYVVHPHKSNRIVAGEAAELTHYLPIICICPMSTISHSGVTTIMGTIMGTVMGTIMGTVMGTITGTTIGTIASEVAILAMHLQSETVTCHSFISHRHNSHMSIVITGRPYALGLACNIDKWIQHVLLRHFALYLKCCMSPWMLCNTLGT